MERRRMNLQLFNEPPAAPSGEAQAPPAAPAASPGTMPSFQAPTGPLRLPSDRPNPLLGDTTPAAAPAQQVPPQPAGAPQQTAPPAAPAPAQSAAPPAAAPAQPPAAPAQPEVLDFSGRQVQVPTDPVMAQALKELYRDHLRQQATLTRAQQELAAMRSQPAPAAAAPSQPAAAPAPQQAPSLEAAIEQAVAAVDVEQLQTDLYENPGKALGPVIKNALAPVISHFEQKLAQVQQQVAPAQEFMQVQQATDTYTNELAEMARDAQQFPDLDRLLPLMDQLSTQMPELLGMKNPMQVLYRYARGYLPAPNASPSAAPAPQPLTVDTVLSNQELLNQILAHPSIRDTITRSYVDSIRSGQPPAQIGAGPGGLPPAAPPNRPRNIAEAGRAFQASLGG